MTIRHPAADAVDRILRDDPGGEHRRHLLERLAGLRSQCDAAARRLQSPADYRHSQAAIVAVKAAVVAVERLRAGRAAPEPPRTGRYEFPGGPTFPPA